MPGCREALDIRASVGHAARVLVVVAVCVGLCLVALPIVGARRQRGVRQVEIPVDRAAPRPPARSERSRRSKDERAGDLGVPTFGLKLSVGTNAAGHLTLAPVGSKAPLTNLTFTPEALEISTDSCRPVALLWSDFGNLRSIMDDQAARDGWTIVRWGMGRSGDFGVAVRVSGRYCELAGPLLSATRTLWRRMMTSGSSFTGRSLPVLPGTTLATRFHREFWTLYMLCRFLADNESARARLGDVQRTRRLAQDLADGWMTFHGASSGVGRDSTDIHVALRQLGLVHPLNRPLTRAVDLSVADIADQVEGVLRSNPHRSGRTSDRAQIEQIVRHHYVDVEPWPFAALVDD